MRFNKLTNLPTLVWLKGIPIDVVYGISYSLKRLIRLGRSPLLVRTTKHLSNGICFVYRVFNKHSYSLFVP